MTERNLAELLEYAASRVPVGAAPIHEMVAGAARQRRRRTLAVTFATAATVVTALGGYVLAASPGNSRDRETSAAVASGSASPPATRLVGLRNAAIAVPTAWGTNETRCGSPVRDTVVIDVGAVPLCLTPDVRGVESVEITEGSPRFDYRPDRTMEIDGVPAERQQTSCLADYGGVMVCTGSTYLPSLKVTFRASSTTSAADVDRILGWIRIVPGEVGVPGYQQVTLNGQAGAQAAYVKKLEDLGLTARIRSRKFPPVGPGFLLGVSPAPGSMVRPGDVVTVTVTATPEGPADEVSVLVNSLNPKGNYRDLDDEQIRTGATIELALGSRIWASPSGKRAAALTGELHGTSLTIDDRPLSWKAVSPGTTRIGLKVTGDGGKSETLGVVTVVVR